MDTHRQTSRLRYVPPIAALSVAFVLQVIVVIDTVGAALAEARPGTDPRVWYALAGGLGVAVASSLEAGAAYLMWLYDRHLRARDSVWQLRAGMVLYVALSALIIHWWLNSRGLPAMIAWVLGGMSASSLWLWSRGSRWAQRQDMIAAGQIDPALPRLPTVSKLLHPIRWINTSYLISWDPVATTDEARARHAEWQATRRFMKRSNAWTTSPLDPSGHTSGSGSSRSASGSGTDAGPHLSTVTPISNAGPAAPSSGTRTPTRKPRPSGPKRSGGSGNSPRRTDTELVSQITANGWTSESLNSLSSKLGVSKRRASALRERAQQSTRDPSAEPEPESEPVPNGAPSDPDTATAAVLAS